MLSPFHTLIWFFTIWTVQKSKFRARLINEIFCRGIRTIHDTFRLTFKMASFSLKYEKDKCRGLNSPVFLKKYSKSQKLRVEALGGDGWKKKSFESNQSLVNNLHFILSEEKEEVEEATAFKNEKVSKHSPILLPMNTYEASFLSDNLFTSSLNLSTSVLSESHGSTNKALFTIHQPTSQILVVNSAACQLTNYSSDELCSMKLENVVIGSQKHKFSNLFKKFLKSLGEMPHSCGKLLELLRKNGETITVLMYLKKLDNPERCLAIVEPIEKKTGLVSVAENGEILSYDEDISHIFQYDASEFLGLNIHTVLPAIFLSKLNDDQSKISKQLITGRTKNGEAFPVCLFVSNGNPNSEEYKIIIWVYTSLNALILLNKNLLITNFNSYFIKLFLGYSKKEVFNLHIENIIPTFGKDIGFEKKNDNIFQSRNNLNLSYSYEKNESLPDLSENILTNESLSSLKSSFSQSFNNITDSSNQCEWSSTSLKMDSELDDDIKTFFTNLNSNQNRNSRTSSDSFQREICFDGNFSCDIPSKLKVEEYKTEQDKNVYDACSKNYQKIVVQEGKFLGFAQHKDRSYIDIKYQVKIAGLSEESFYCVWISRDLSKFPDIRESLRTNMISSLNSVSIDGSLPKNSVSSEQCTRPSTASLISQCDENLTAGDYSRCYTNIKQIGKGAFGYVKMGFRNSDGLLVVTKFIKKQSINIRAWVFHSDLNMRIPLEVSLLTTLYHPNIVKVLDVFHNDSFVQLVMEKHGAGFDLFEFINRGPKCDEKLKSYIFRQIISAVHYLDSLGILHRDIKDENVIINEKFEVKLIDFGSATFMPPNETFSKFYGTVEYCSPEVLQGNSYKGPELEIWALGVTLYVLTFGENPFYNTEEAIQGQFSIPFSISKELDDLLHKMLDKNVDSRITIDKVVKHPWIDQPVAIENYRFEEVVRCSNEEAYPPKFVHEIKLEEFFAKDFKSESNRFGNTYTSSGSLQNLPDIDEFGDNSQETQRSSLSDIVGRKTNVSSVLLSSTPVPWKNDRLCKSATTVSNCLQNCLSFSDCSYKCHDISYVENESFLKNNCLKHFKTISSSDNEFGVLEEDLPVFNDIYETELERRLQDCHLLEEENVQINNSLQIEVLHNVKEGHDLFSEKRYRKFLGSAEDIKFFKPK